MKTLDIEVYCIAFNEAETIHLTINHYLQFCSKFILYDNYSTDNTREIAKSNGAEVRLFGEKGVLSDKWYLKIKNHDWKQSKADYVIVIDSDEILWHPNLERVLIDSKAAGHTIFKTWGWNVFSNEIPRGTFTEVNTGFHDPNYSKSVIFDPKKIRAINYAYGCHTAQPMGELSYAPDVLTLFHYRNIGGIQRLLDRHKLYRKRMSPLNKELKLGVHYLYDDERRIKEWHEQLQKCTEYSPDFVSG